MNRAGSRQRLDDGLGIEDATTPGSTADRL
jgi:hypothetical protein